MIKAEVKKNSVPLMYAATETAPGHLAIRGPLSKDPFSEDETAAYSVIAEWIRAQGPESTIVLDIDSPGGDVSGVESLVALIESRPGVTLAEISGDCASAAYWIASACDKVTAVPSALIGSIGTMKEGGPCCGDISTSIYSPRKNAEDEQWQEIIDAACERFLAHIAKHRGFEETDFHALAQRCGEGKLMTAAEALDRGLIDALIEEGSMNPDEMPEVEREEQSVEETIRDLRMVIEDHEKRIAEMELKLQDLRDDKEDLDAEGEEDTLKEGEKKDEEEEKKDVEAKCQKPSARSTRQISALEARLRAVERARRDDLVLRLMAEGKIKSKSEAEIAKNTYDTNRSLFDRVYGRPAAMSTVSRISSGDAASSRKNMTPSQKAFAALAAGKYKSFAEAFQAEGGR